MKPFSHPYIEQKPRILYSPMAHASWGKGWIAYFFEGAIVFNTFDEAWASVKSYYLSDMLVNLPSPSQYIN